MGDERPTALLIDFDSTAALDNVGMALIHNFAGDDSWKVIDEDYENGRIGSRQAFRLLGPLLRGTATEWRDYVLTHHHLDRGLKDLVDFGLLNGWRVEILSDGIDFYITALLNEAGIHLDIRASSLCHTPSGVDVFSPFLNPLCGRCGTCKSDRILELSNIGYSVIFIGDGVSDFCAAPKAHRIFAKDELADHLLKKGVPFEKFESLYDVVRALKSAPAERIKDHGQESSP